MNEFTGAVAYGSRNIVFKVQFAQRTTMEIAVLPDSSVVVKAPLGTSTEEIEKRVKKRGGWVREQQFFFNQYQPRTPPRRYLGGESHLYLGRKYRLKLLDEAEFPGQPGNDSSDRVKLANGYFWIRCTDVNDTDQIRRLLHDWYLTKAKKQFTQRFTHCWQSFERFQLPCPNLRMRSMKTRWGSLAPSGNLTLNTQLIRAPMECIDYVIAHELCHLKHHYHDSGFYALLEHVMPDYKRRKQRLELALI